jgi:hypothetical protein
MINLFQHQRLYLASLQKEFFLIVCEKELSIMVKMVKVYQIFFYRYKTYNILNTYAMYFNSQIIF